MERPTLIPPFELEQLDDGCLRVRLGEMAGTVSSHHLIEPKKHQLMAAWLSAYSTKTKP